MDEKEGELSVCAKRSPHGGGMRRSRTVSGSEPRRWLETAETTGTEALQRNVWVSCCLTFELTLTAEAGAVSPD